MQTKAALLGLERLNFAAQIEFNLFDGWKILTKDAKSGLRTSYSSLTEFAHFMVEKWGIQVPERASAADALSSTIPGL